MKNLFLKFFQFTFLTFMVVFVSGCTSPIDIDDDGVNPPPTVDFSYDIGDGVAPVEVSFRVNAAYGVKTYEWDFGDGSAKSYVEYPRHTYQKSGTYKVSLTVKNDVNKKATKVQEITLARRPTTATITKVTLDSMPFQRPNGEKWYIYGEPDVYFKITDLSSTRYLGNQYAADWRRMGMARLPISYSILSENLDRGKIANFDAVYFIELWYDPFTGSDEEIGKIKFTINEFRTPANQFPQEIVLRSDKIKMRLELRWDGEDVPIK